jgi:hypothetical protein
VARLRSMPAQYDGEVVGHLAELLKARQQGWRSEDTKVVEPVSVISRAKRPGQVHPQSAFFQAVYPPVMRRRA